MAWGSVASLPFPRCCDQKDSMSVEKEGNWTGWGWEEAGNLRQSAQVGGAEDGEVLSNAGMRCVLINSERFQ